MNDALDYKKKYRELYLPKTIPSLVDVPKMAFITADGKGDPNDVNGEFGTAVELLYAIQYTIKMSKKKQNTPAGYFDYVVPPLEGLWWVKNKKDIGNKSKYTWTIMIRLPEFVTEKTFRWACDEAARAKKINTEKARYLTMTEELCVQCMHIGPFDDEPKTIALIDAYCEKNNLLNDMSETRRHHEIYLSDFRKTAPEKLKTVLRIPVRRK
ncbi:MAG: GyrI-like domain-containing protein [Treponema sp.]|jgi:hypothetical protein|nr:GyrI-like domain-containing protein [Treponema sp.]